MSSVMYSDKVCIGLDHAPRSFDICGRVVGEGEANLEFIRSETGAMIILKGGIGSKANPLNLSISHSNIEKLSTARKLALSLVDSVRQELEQWIESQESPTPQLNKPPPSFATQPPLVTQQPQLVTKPPFALPPQLATQPPFALPPQLATQSPFAQPPQLATQFPFAQSPQLATQNLFGQPPQLATQSPFGQPPQLATPSPFVKQPSQLATQSPFAQPPQLATQNPFGQPPQLATQSPFGQPPQLATPSPFVKQPSQLATQSPFLPQLPQHVAQLPYATQPQVPPQPSLPVVQASPQTLQLVPQQQIFVGQDGSHYVKVSLTQTPLSSVGPLTALPINPGVVNVAPAPVQHPFGNQYPVGALGRPAATPTPTVCSAPTLSTSTRPLAAGQSKESSQPWDRKEQNGQLSSQTVSTEAQRAPTWSDRRQNSPPPPPKNLPWFQNSLNKPQESSHKNDREQAKPPISVWNNPGEQNVAGQMEQRWTERANVNSGTSKKEDTLNTDCNKMKDNREENDRDYGGGSGGRGSKRDRRGRPYDKSERKDTRGSRANSEERREPNQSRRDRHYQSPQKQQTIEEIYTQQTSNSHSEVQSTEHQSKWDRPPAQTEVSTYTPPQMYNQQEMMNKTKQQYELSQYARENPQNASQSDGNWNRNREERPIWDRSCHPWNRGNQTDVYANQIQQPPPPPQVSNQWPYWSGPC